jgi:beta-aspartyl-peptidase (threonine type)
MSEIILAVHGGAGRLKDSQTSPPKRAAYERGLAAALRAGQAILLDGGSAVDAACAAVASLEDNECFNAGRGSVLCSNGEVELSASVMDGSDGSAGAMVGLKRVRYPVLGARAVLSHMHGLLFGAAADAYAEAEGLEMVAPDYFLTDERRAQWEKLRGKGTVALDHSDADAVHGTVGAVARDAKGNLAAATSTGGLANQLPGRVGDTPVVGAGTWAQNTVCAVSATGKGDAFARIAFARRLADLMELGKLSAGEAAASALGDVARVGGEGGCILLTPQGEVHMPFTTPQMLRGRITGNGAPIVGILPGEKIEMA